MAGMVRSQRALFVALMGAVVGVALVSVLALVSDEGATRTVLDIHDANNPIPVDVGRWQTDNSVTWCGDDPDCGYGNVALNKEEAYADPSPLAIINEDYKEGQLNPFPGPVNFGPDSPMSWAPAEEMPDLPGMVRASAGASSSCQPRLSALRLPLTGVLVSPALCTFPRLRPPSHTPTLVYRALRHVGEPVWLIQKVFFFSSFLSSSGCHMYLLADPHANPHLSFQQARSLPPSLRCASSSCVLRRWRRSGQSTRGHQMPGQIRRRVLCSCCEWCRRSADRCVCNAAGRNWLSWIESELWAESSALTQ